MYFHKVLIHKNLQFLSRNSETYCIMSNIAKQQKILNYLRIPEIVRDIVRSKYISPLFRTSTNIVSIVSRQDEVDS